jgi:transposase InsO family protein
VWTPEQLRTFLRHVRPDRFHALWLPVATTGLRRGELAGLTRGDADLDGARISPSTTRVVVAGMPPTRIRRPQAATVIDLCTRMIVGWQLADHMRTSLVIDALQMAITHGHTRPGAISIPTAAANTPPGNSHSSAPR